MSQIVPLFSSDSSIGKSILSLEDNEKKDEESGKMILKDLDGKTPMPISIFSIARRYDLKQLFLVENSMVGFIKAFKLAEKLNIQFCFGIKLVCCDDINQKNEESRKSEHKIIVWLKDSAGYSNLCKIFSASWLKGMYYVNRIDFKTLNELWDDRYFTLFCDSYSGFLSRNLLEDYICNPNFGNIRPILTYGRQNLPFDYLIENTVKKYAESNKLDVIQSHNIYYYKDSDSKAYQIFRAINKRTKYSMPNMNHFSSSSFSWESYAKLVGIKFE